MTSQPFFITAAHPNHYRVGDRRDWMMFKRAKECSGKGTVSIQLSR